MEKKKCWLFDGCPGRTGWCRISQPDDETCVVYRRFKEVFVKEQEPVPPEWFTFEDDITGEEYKLPMCGVCGRNVIDCLYCPECGRAVKWE